MDMTGKLEHTGEDRIDENYRTFVTGCQVIRQSHGIDARRFQTYADLITRVQLLGLLNLAEELLYPDSLFGIVRLSLITSPVSRMMETSCFSDATSTPTRIIV